LDVPTVLTRVGGWLASHGLSNSYLRAAIITAAAANGQIPSPAVVYAALVGDATDMARLRRTHGDWIVDRSLEAFLSESSWAHGTGWIRKPLEPWRAAMAGIALGGSVRRQSLVASVDGITNDELIKDNLVSGRCSHWQPPLEFEDGWVRSHRCTRPTCPGGGDTPMTGFLPVPELLIRGDAVFCTYCWCSKNSNEPIPQVYRQRWDVQTCTTALRRADGIPFIAPARPAPVITCGSVRTRDIAKALGVPTRTVERLANDNLIPSTKTMSGKRRLDARLADSPQLQALVHCDESAGARGNPGGDVTEATLVGRKCAAERLGIKVSYLRILVRNGALANHAMTSAVGAYSASEIEDLLDNVRVQLGDDTATFRDLVKRSELAADWGVTAPTVTYMARAEVIKGVTLGELGLVSRASVAALDPRIAAALNPWTRLAAPQVAKLAGLGTATVLYHAGTGSLPSVQLYPRGRVYFLPEEAKAWIVRRASTQRDPNA
jgi:hypothetical protein